MNTNCAILTLTLTGLFRTSEIGCSHPSAGSLVLEAINTDIDPCENFEEMACGKWKSDAVNLRLARGENYWSAAKEAEEANRRDLYLAINRIGTINLKSYQGKLKTAFDICRRKVDTATIVEEIYNVFEEVGGWPIMESNWTGHENDKATILGNFLSKYWLDSLPFAVSASDTILHVTPSFSYSSINQTYYGVINSVTYINKYLKREVENESALEEEAMEVENLQQKWQYFVLNAPVWVRFHSLKEIQNMTNSQSFSMYNFLKTFLQSKIEPPDELVLSLRSDLHLLTSAFEEHFGSVSTRVFQNYLVFRLLDEIMVDLVNNLGEDSSPQYDNTMYCIQRIDQDMTTATQHIFHVNYFSPDVVPQLKFYGHQFIGAYHRMIRDAKSLSERTRKRFIDKIMTIAQVMISPSYPMPDYVINHYYKELLISENDTWWSVMKSLGQFRLKTSLTKLLEPWQFDSDFRDGATSVQAYYRFYNNLMLLSTGMLRPPYFSHNYTIAYNLGALGFYIGHEIGHAFDRGGRHFQWKTAPIEDIWDPSWSAIEADLQCIRNYSNSLCANDNVTEMCLNGQLTENENFADYQGIRAAFMVFQQLKNYDPANGTIEGLEMFTPEQQFFLSFARSVCAVYTKQRAYSWLQEDKHAPAPFRIEGILSNFPAFAKAFNCTPGQRYFPVNQCKIWDI